MKNILKAIADFQQDCPVILKDTSGYGYKYADLTQIDSVIKPLLKKHGIMIVQPLNGNTITTIIFHIETGEKIESVCNVPFDSIKYEPVITETTKGGVTEKKTNYLITGFSGMNTAQACGSLITYFRRYTISSLLGLITDKDTDGTGVQEPQTTQVQKASVQVAPQPAQLTPAQIKLQNEWNEKKEQIEVEIKACTDEIMLQITADNYPEFAKVTSFKKMIADKELTLK